VPRAGLYSLGYGPHDLYRLTMPSDESRPPYVSEAGHGSPIDVARVRSALADWKRLERSGPPSLRRAAARQVRLCEAMLQAAEDDGPGSESL
jgi:hypothetical protein